MGCVNVDVHNAFHSSSRPLLEPQPRMCCGRGVVVGGCGRGVVADMWWRGLEAVQGTLTASVWRGARGGRRACLEVLLLWGILMVSWWGLAGWAGGRAGHLHGEHLGCEWVAGREQGVAERQLRLEQNVARLGEGGVIMLEGVRWV